MFSKLLPSGVVDWEDGRCSADITLDNYVQILILLFIMCTYVSMYVHVRPEEGIRSPEAGVRSHPTWVLDELRSSTEIFLTSELSLQLLVSVQNIRKDFGLDLMLVSMGQQVKQYFIITNSHEILSIQLYFIHFSQPLASNRRKQYWR